MDNNSVNEGKTAAIISYLWWVGLIIAFIMNHNKRNYFTSFHIRQSIGLSIFSFFISILTRFAFPMVGSALYLGLFILWVIVEGRSMTFIC